MLVTLTTSTNKQAVEFKTKALKSNPTKIGKIKITEITRNPIITTIKEQRQK